ncbi:Probable peroxygenase 4, partial [Linum perenne]
GKFPSPLFPIEIKFVPEKFEEIFAKHAKTNRHALTSEELGEMLKSNREPKNYSGWLASYSEWKILFHLGKDKNGLLQKDTVRSVYDGSLFERMENEKHLLNKP